MEEKKNYYPSDILSFQEAERKRIADELHDTTVQELVYLSQQLDLTNLYFDKDVNQARLELASARKSIKDIIEGIRSTIYDLHPMSLDDIGWDAAFTCLQQEIEKNNIHVIFHIEKPENINQICAVTIYRIIREACINVIKHAEATELTVRMMEHDDEKLLIEIIDNGIGFSNKKKEENHFGMQMMKERIDLLSGSFDIMSQRKKGTKITIYIPLAANAKEP